MVLITFTDAQNLDGYRMANELPFPILMDTDRSAYRAFGLGRGSVGRVYGHRAAVRYLQIFRDAYRSGGVPDRHTVKRLAGVIRPTEDPLQLGGDFLVGPDGRLAYGFWGRGPDDRPNVDELVGAIRALDTQP